MHMFFAVATKDGRPLSDAERQSFETRIREEVVFSAHVTRVVSVAPDAGSLVVGVSNEPSGGWRETSSGHVFVCGYCCDEAALERLGADEQLAERASRLSGRFSVLVVDQRARRFAVATQPARVDSIFHAATDRYVFWGNQASTVSALRDGEVRFAPNQLVTLINAGFFGDDSTPYAGVEAVKSFTTVVVQGSQVREDTRSLSSLKPQTPGRLRRWVEPRLPARFRASEGAGLNRKLDVFADEFVRAFAPLKGVGPVDLGLTGGMDSRLLLAGGLAAGVDIHCFTHIKGNRNQSDVWVAKQVAERTKVPHRLMDRENTEGESATPGLDELLKSTRNTLAATDGMMGLQYPVTPNHAYVFKRAMSGQGGEILRGGYGEKATWPTRARAASHMHKLWNHSPRLFHPELVSKVEAGIGAYLASFPEEFPGIELLDCLYVDRRCGRWAAASTAASTTRIRPLLDNVVVRHALAIPASAKKKHLVHRGLIERLRPELRNLPMADNFWVGTPAAAQRQIRHDWPEAFSEVSEKQQRKKTGRELAPEREAAIKRYVVDEGRLNLLEQVIRVDEVVRYLKATPKSYRNHDRFLMGLFTATVLVSGDWRRRRARVPQAQSRPRRTMSSSSRPK